MSINIYFLPLITLYFISNFAYANVPKLVHNDVLASIEVGLKRTQITNKIEHSTFQTEVEKFRQRTFHSSTSTRTFKKLAITNDDNTYYRYALEIPKEYRHSEKYPLIVFLHGGLSKRPWKNTDVWWNRYLESDTQKFIALYPTATLSIPWWSDLQSEKLRTIINDIKLNYSVDSNKVFLVGISDGGAGAIYQSVLLNDIIAGAVSVIGSPSVLAANDNAVSKNIYEPNLANLPLLMINSEDDPIYPASKIELIVKYLQNFAPQIQFVSVKGKHNLKVLRDNNRLIHQFIKENSRTIYPDSLTWQIESTSRVQRNTWVLVSSPNPLLSKHTLSKGLRKSNLPTSMIKLTKSGNGINVEMSHPLSITFLLSPEHFDFQSPVSITINGTLIFNDKVEKNLNVLKKWVEIDNSAERVFGAELNFTQSFITRSVDFPD